MTHGFPIGDIPLLARTYTPKNHKSALKHLDVIRSYCNDEVALGRMSGLFTRNEIHNILGGHFVSSPLGVVEKSGEPGKFRVIRDLSYCNDDGFSVNSHLDSDDFPTEWGTAAQVADLVSLFSLYSSCTSCTLFLYHLSCTFRTLSSHTFVWPLEVFPFQHGNTHYRKGKMGGC